MHSTDVQSATHGVGIGEAMVRELAIERLRSALCNAFLTMAGLEVTIGPVLPLDADCVDQGKLVASLIGWTGEWSGTGVLESTPEFACVLTNLLLGTELDQLNEDALNCIAEMSNIVFGNVKTDLEAMLGPMALQIPTVIYGSGMGMWSPAGEFIVLPVRIDRHFLRAKLCVVYKNEDGHPANRSLRSESSARVS